ncbi:hypothetical protein DMA12_41945 [Amycolatopsis balhimycina DSM 5908]|uniref:AAA+ ATPase domain-containing protein n=1 Tax=Amycolatopsis balhimycina DSM 5908 TaxID=1081091 RepID=A0A428VZ06_AMYBA|nr:hypothetical protein [Amycolatopsis balhimycina]RSM36041.1 hypothetical protein DMA12_41945 [Amycolatopsis balhimycina DSM 5908]
MTQDFHDALPKSLSQKFSEALRDQPTGAIGLIGPRGVGKTSLLLACARGDFDVDGTDKPVTVMMRAPIRYDPTEFLYAVYEALRAAVPPDELPREAPLRELVAKHVKQIRRSPETLSQPQVAGALGRFTTLVASDRRVRILIDKLDHVAPPERVSDFLTDIREVLGVPNCQLVIAASDALAAETLAEHVDRTIRLEGLALSESVALLETAVPGLPPRLLCFLHCVAGGVPRRLRQLARIAVDSAPVDPSGDSFIHEILWKEFHGVDNPPTAALQGTLVKAFTIDVDDEWFRRAVNETQWAGSFDSLGHVRNLLGTDPARAAAKLAGFRTAWGLGPQVVTPPAGIEPEPFREPVDEPPEESDPDVLELEREWLPQLIGEELESTEAQRAIKRMNLDRGALAAEIASSALLQDVVATCSSRLGEDLQALSESLLDKHTGRNLLTGTLTAVATGGVATVSVSWVVGTLTVVAVVVAAGVQFGVERSNQARLSERRERLKARWRRDVVELGVRPASRLALNKALQPVLWFSLVITDQSGLNHAAGDEFVVDTGSVRRFDRAARRVRSGALGLAGPRGSGKTTLIGRWVRDELDRVAIQVPAPIRYEPRDFVLHLHSALCLKVIRGLGRGGPGTGVHPDWGLLLDREHRRKQIWLVLRFLFWAGVVLCAATGWAIAALGLSAPKTMFGELLARRSTGDLPALLILLLGSLGAAGIAGTLLAVVWLKLRRRGWSLLRVLRSMLTRTKARSKQDLLVDLARRDLTQIRFLQTLTTGWSGKLTLPLKIDLSRTRSTQVSQRPLTHPELVGQLQRFIQQLAEVLAPRDGRPSVVIGIDELDKVEPAEDAQRFVNEIKGVFGVPGCQFVVSVSEEALTAFERRGLAFRDAFDSAFDEIVRVDHLSLSDADHMLSKRVTGMSEPFRYLCHCLSGGLPRELIRVARNIAELSGPDTMPMLAEVTERLVVDELGRKATSLQEAAARIGAGADVAAFVRMMHTCTANPTPAMLLRNAPAVTTVDDSPLGRLRLESHIYLRYAATLLQVFDNDLDRTELRVASATAEDPGSFDALASVQQQMGLHPMVAAVALDRFRLAWNLDPGRHPADRSFASSELLLQPDGGGLPAELRWLCHCLSGGAPHSLLRTAKRAVALLNNEPPPSLDRVVHRLVGDDLRERLENLHEQAVKLGLGPDIADLRKTLRGCAHGTANDLLTAAGPALPNGNRLAALRAECRVHLRFAATVLQLFASGRVPTDGSLDALATVPQLVATGAADAGKLIDQIRVTYHLYP